MAEIILPPEENEESPQVPELNIDKPIDNSKVITIEFEAKKTNKVSIKDTIQQLYTTDTDAWFEFKETSLEGANGTYSVVFINRHDGSIFQRTGDVVNGVAYYKIPHQEIRHAGAWRGQIVYTLSNGDTTSREFGYDVKGHILDGKDVREIVVEDFETLMSQLRSMKDSVELELAELAQELENMIDTANQNEINETNRQANELAREEAESKRVSNEAERISKDGERDSKIEEIENSIVGKRIGGYTFNGNTEVHVTNLDEETGVFTATNHGLVNGMRCAVALNLDTPLINKTSLPDPLQTGWRFIVNATQDTFQVSDSRDGEPVLFTPNLSLDTNLWHLEANNSPVTSIDLQSFSETELTIRFRAKSHVQASNVFRLTLNDIEIANNFYSEVDGLLTRDTHTTLQNYGHSNLAMFGEYKASLSEHAMIGKVNFYCADLATRTNPHSELSYKVFKDTIWAANTNKIDAFRGVELHLGGHMLLNGSTLEVYNG